MSSLWCTQCTWVDWHGRSRSRCPTYIVHRPAKVIFTTETLFVKFSANNFILEKSFKIIILNVRPTRVKHATEIFIWMLSRSRNAVFLGMDMVWNEIYVWEYIYQVHDYEIHAASNIKEAVTSSFVDCFSRFALFLAGFDSVLIFYSAGKMAEIDSPYCCTIGHRPFLRKQAIIYLTILDRGRQRNIPFLLEARVITTLDPAKIYRSVALPWSILIGLLHRKLEWTWSNLFREVTLQLTRSLAKLVK